MLTAVSEGMVALLKEYYGRGPTQAKTYYYDDLVVCVMRGGFTRVEQTLLDGLAATRRCSEQRAAFQEVTRRAHHRRSSSTRRAAACGGFMSGNQQAPDMICEVFVLSPTDLFADHELPTEREVRTDH